MFPLPTRIAPALRSFFATVASYGLMYPSRIFDPHDVLSIRRRDVVLEHDRHARELAADRRTLRPRAATCSSPTTERSSTRTDQRRLPRRAQSSLRPSSARASSLRALPQRSHRRPRAAVLPASRSRFVSRVFVRREARHEEEAVDHARHHCAIECPCLRSDLCDRSLERDARSLRPRATACPAVARPPRPRLPNSRTFCSTSICARIPLSSVTSASSRSSGTPSLARPAM